MPNTTTHHPSSKKQHLTTQQTLQDLHMNSSDQFYKKQDVYNAIESIQRTQLGNLTLIQALLKELTASEKWYIAYTLDS